MELEVIVEVGKIVVIGLGLVATVYGSMNQHAKKKLKTILFVRDLVQKGVQEAESISEYKGQAKKQHVITKVVQHLMSKGFKVDYDLIDREIEASVELSKQVNKRPERNPNMQDQSNSVLRNK